MHNMFYLPCGSHKIFTSSSHYSQSESRRALEPTFPGVPPPRTDPASPGMAAGAAVVVVPGPDKRPGPRWCTWGCRRTLASTWKTPPGSAGGGRMGSAALAEGDCTDGMANARAAQGLGLP